MEALAKEFAGRATVVKLDIDTLWFQNRKLVERYQITSLPLFIVFKDGHEVARLAGKDHANKTRAHEALTAALATP